MCTQKVRYFVEDVQQRPLDWSGESDRNLLMYESAQPLAELYEPLVHLNVTFVLQVRDGGDGGEPLQRATLFCRSDPVTSALFCPRSSLCPVLSLSSG